MLARKAFSIVELTLSIGLLGIMFALGIPAYREYMLNSALNTTADQLLFSLNRAKILSMTQEGNSQWGVRVNPGQIIIYKGTSYATDDPAFREISTFSPTITATNTNIDTPASNEINFELLTGRASDEGEFILSQSLGGQLRSIIVEQEDDCSYLPSDLVTVCMGGATRTVTYSELAEATFTFGECPTGGGGGGFATCDLCAQCNAGADIPGFTTTNTWIPVGAIPPIANGTCTQCNVRQGNHLLRTVNATTPLCGWASDTIDPCSNKPAWHLYKNTGLNQWELHTGDSGYYYAPASSWTCDCTSTITFTEANSNLNDNCDWPDSIQLYGGSGPSCTTPALCTTSSASSVSSSAGPPQCPNDYCSIPGMPGCSQVTNYYSLMGAGLGPINVFDNQCSDCNEKRSGSAYANPWGLTNAVVLRKTSCYWDSVQDTFSNTPMNVDCPVGQPAPAWRMFYNTATSRWELYSGNSGLYYVAPAVCADTINFTLASSTIGSSNHCSNWPTNITATQRGGLGLTCGP